MSFCFNYLWFNVYERSLKQIFFCKNMHLFIAISNNLIYVTLDHKTSLKSLGYICSNSQKYIVWVKIIIFSFMPKIIRILSKDHVP